ncbi:hypothetical protein V1264_010848 [Littorina saxatilis]|uniref:TASOR pseudo-PARP domain-containing protein n=1 Tax=Littorina saxatilis TaxID=31220 RepID=A0AAN9BTV3_9CAEN
MAKKKQADDFRLLSSAAALKSIPKIKKVKSTVLLNYVSSKDREALQLTREVDNTCFDPDRKSRKQWKENIIYTVNPSPALEKRYREKRGELKEQGGGRLPQEVLGFLVCKDRGITIKIAREGLRVNRNQNGCLGDPRQGVYLFRYLDVALLSVSHTDQRSVDILVCKVLQGRTKPVPPSDAGSFMGTPREPTPNYDAHVSQSAPRAEDSVGATCNKSQMYLYEYTDDAEPAEYPRQCLPYAVIEYGKDISVADKTQKSFLTSAASAGWTSALRPSGDAFRRAPPVEPFRTSTVESPGFGNPAIPQPHLPSPPLTPSDAESFSSPHGRDIFSHPVGSANRASDTERGAWQTRSNLVSVPMEPEAPSPSLVSPTKPPYHAAPLSVQELRLCDSGFDAAELGESLPSASGDAAKDPRQRQLSGGQGDGVTAGVDSSEQENCSNPAQKMMATVNRLWGLASVPTSAQPQQGPSQSQVESDPMDSWGLTWNGNDNENIPVQNGPSSHTHSGQSKHILDPRLTRGRRSFEQEKAFNRHLFERGLSVGSSLLSDKDLASLCEPGNQMGMLPHVPSLNRTPMKSALKKPSSEPPPPAAEADGKKKKTLSYQDYLKKKAAQAQASTEAKENAEINSLAGSVGANITVSLVTAESSANSEVLGRSAANAQTTENHSHRQMDSAAASSFGALHPRRPEATKTTMAAPEQVSVANDATSAVAGGSDHSARPPAGHHFSVNFQQVRRDHRQQAAFRNPYHQPSFINNNTANTGLSDPRQAASVASVVEPQDERRTETCGNQKLHARMEVDHKGTTATRLEHQTPAGAKNRDPRQGQSQVNSSSMSSYTCHQVLFSDTPEDPDSQNALWLDETHSQETAGESTSETSVAAKGDRGEEDQGESQNSETKRSESEQQNPGSSAATASLTDLHVQISPSGETSDSSSQNTPPEKKDKIVSKLLLSPALLEEQLTTVCENEEDKARLMRIAKGLRESPALSSTEDSRRSRNVSPCSDLFLRKSRNASPCSDLSQRKSRTVSPCSDSSSRKSRNGSPCSDSSARTSSMFSTISSNSKESTPDRLSSAGQPGKKGKAKGKRGGKNVLHSNDEYFALLRLSKGLRPGKSIQVEGLGKNPTPDPLPELGDCKGRKKKGQANKAKQSGQKAADKKKGGAGRKVQATEKGKAKKKRNTGASIRKRSRKKDQAEVDPTPPVDDEEIDYTDFGFEQPQDFCVSIPDELEKASGQESPGSGATEAGEGDERGQALPLSYLGLSHWTEALVQPSLDPQVILVDLVKAYLGHADFENCPTCQNLVVPLSMLEGDDQADDTESSPVEPTGAKRDVGESTSKASGPLAAELNEVKDKKDISVEMKEGEPAVVPLQGSQDPSLTRGLASDVSSKPSVLATEKEADIEKESSDIPSSASSSVTSAESVGSVHSETRTIPSNRDAAPELTQGEGFVRPYTKPAARIESSDGFRAGTGGEGEKPAAQGESDGFTASCGEQMKDIPHDTGSEKDANEEPCDPGTDLQHTSAPRDNENIRRMPENGAQLISNTLPVPARASSSETILIPESSEPNSSEITSSAKLLPAGSSKRSRSAEETDNAQKETGQLLRGRSLNDRSSPTVRSPVVTSSLRSTRPRESFGVSSQGSSMRNWQNWKSSQAMRMQASSASETEGSPQSRSKVLNVRSDTEISAHRSHPAETASGSEGQSVSDFSDNEYSNWRVPEKVADNCVSVGDVDMRNRTETGTGQLTAKNAGTSSATGAPVSLHSGFWLGIDELKSAVGVENTQEIVSRSSTKISPSKLSRLVLAPPTAPPESSYVQSHLGVSSAQRTIPERSQIQEITVTANKQTHAGSGVEETVNVPSRTDDHSGTGLNTHGTSLFDKFEEVCRQQRVPLISMVNSIPGLDLVHSSFAKAQETTGTSEHAVPSSCETEANTNAVVTVDLQEQPMSYMDLVEKVNMIKKAAQDSNTDETRDDDKEQSTPRDKEKKLEKKKSQDIIPSGEDLDVVGTPQSVGFKITQKQEALLWKSLERSKKIESVENEESKDGADEDDGQDSKARVEVSEEREAKPEEACGEDAAGRPIPSFTRARSGTKSKETKSQVHPNESNADTTPCRPVSPESNKTSSSEVVHSQAESLYQTSNLGQPDAPGTEQHCDKELMGSGHFDYGQSGSRFQQDFCGGEPLYQQSYTTVPMVVQSMPYTSRHMGMSMHSPDLDSIPLPGQPFMGYPAHHLPYTEPFYRGPHHRQTGPPPMMGGPPGHLSGPPPQYPGLHSQISGPPPGMSGPPSHPQGPPPQMSGPPPGMSGPPLHPQGPPPTLSGPPPQAQGPPPQMSAPPPQLAGPPQDQRPQLTGPPPLSGPPPPPPSTAPPPLLAPPLPGNRSGQQPPPPGVPEELSSAGSSGQSLSSNSETGSASNQYSTSHQNTGTVSDPVQSSSAIDNTLAVTSSQTPLQSHAEDATMEKSSKRTDGKMNVMDWFAERENANRNPLKKDMIYWFSDILGGKRNAKTMADYEPELKKARTDGTEPWAYTRMRPRSVEERSRDMRNRGTRSGSSDSDDMIRRGSAGSRNKRSSSPRDDEDKTTKRRKGVVEGNKISFTVGANTKRSAPLRKSVNLLSDSDSETERESRRDPDNNRRYFAKERKTDYKGRKRSTETISKARDTPRDSQKQDRPSSGAGLPETNSTGTEKRPGSPKSGHNSTSTEKRPGSPKSGHNSTSTEKRPGSPKSGHNSTSTEKRPGSPKSGHDSTSTEKRPSSPKSGHISDQNESKKTGSRWDKQDKDSAKSKTQQADRDSEAKDGVHTTESNKPQTHHVDTDDEMNDYAHALLDKDLNVADLQMISNTITATMLKSLSSSSKADSTSDGASTTPQQQNVSKLEDTGSKEKASKLSEKPLEFLYFAKEMIMKKLSEEVGKSSTPSDQVSSACSSPQSSPEKQVKKPAGHDLPASEAEKTLQDSQTDVSSRETKDTPTPKSSSQSLDASDPLAVSEEEIAKLKNIVCKLACLPNLPRASSSEQNNSEESNTGSAPNKESGAMEKTLGAQAPELPMKPSGGRDWSLFLTKPSYRHFPRVGNERKNYYGEVLDAPSSASQASATSAQNVSSRWESSHQKAQSERDSSGSKTPNPPSSTAKSLPGPKSAAASETQNKVNSVTVAKTPTRGVSETTVKATMEEHSSSGRQPSKDKYEMLSPTTQNKHVSTKPTEAKETSVSPKTLGKPSASPTTRNQGRTDTHACASAPVKTDSPQKAATHPRTGVTPKTCSESKPDASQKTPVKSQRDSSQKSTSYSNAVKPRPEVKKPQVTVKKPEVAVKKPEVSVKKPDVSVKKPEVSVKKPDVSIKKPEVSVKKPDVSVKKPEVTATTPKPTEPDAPQKASVQPKPESSRRTFSKVKSPLSPKPHTTIKSLTTQNEIAQGKTNVTSTTSGPSSSKTAAATKLASETKSTQNLNCAPATQSSSKISDSTTSSASSRPTASTSRVATTQAEISKQLTREASTTERKKQPEQPVTVTPTESGISSTAPLDSSQSGVYTLRDFLCSHFPDVDVNSVMPVLSHQLTNDVKTMSNKAKKNILFKVRKHLATGGSAASASGVSTGAAGCPPDNQALNTYEGASTSADAAQAVEDIPPVVIPRVLLLEEFVVDQIKLELHLVVGCLRLLEATRAVATNSNDFEQRLLSDSAVKSALSFVIQEFDNALRDLDNCGAGRPNQRVPSELLLPEEHGALYTREGAFLVLQSTIPRKPFTRLLQCRNDVEICLNAIGHAALGNHTQVVLAERDRLDRLQGLRRQLMRTFTGAVNTNRLKKLRSLHTHYDNAQQHLLRVLGRDNVERMVFFRASFGAVENHLHIVESEMHV